MTQRDLSVRYGEPGAPISDSQLSKIERGLWFPRPAALRAIAEALGVTVDDLLNGTVPAGQP